MLINNQKIIVGCAVFICPLIKKNLLRGYRFLLTSFFMAALLCHSSVYAQSDDSGSLVPIISLLLSEDEQQLPEPQCPIVTEATTQIGNLIISTQEDLNALTGVTRYEGNLLFSFPIQTVVDFSALDSLVELTGNLTFNNTGITNIVGFDCLTTVGGDLSVSNNVSLTNLSGFAALTSMLVVT